MENNIVKSNNDKKNKAKTKWLDIKALLQNKLILEKSINEIKASTLSQYSSKFCEIYKEKIKIHFLLEKNKNLISNWNKGEKSKIKPKGKDLNKIIVTTDLNELNLGSEEYLKKLFFYFRKNNTAIIRFLKFVPFERYKSFAKFLCHFSMIIFYLKEKNRKKLFLLYIYY